MSAILNKGILAIVLGLLTLGPLAMPGRAQTPSDDIQSMLEQRDRQIKTMLGDKDTFPDAQREELKTVINDVIDFEAMGKQALGPYWEELAPEQRQEFVEVFSEIVRTQSLSNLDIYRSKVTYDDVTVDGQEARVATTTVYKDVPTKVVYLLGLDGQDWRVHDIILDDVSTAEGYARSFQSVVRKKGFDALMESLRKKLDKVATSEG